jgi:ABC-type enterobactin transport system permease subunit
MNKALWKAGRNTAKSYEVRGLDWRRKMSDHIAYALLAYTGLQIWVTMGALKSSSGSILPYFALVVLVAAIIPGCRLIERRWEALDDGEAADPELAPLFKRDRLLVWVAAIGLPFLVTGVAKGIALIA